MGRKGLLVSYGPFQPLSTPLKEVSWSILKETH